jgi:hypothetical protein
MGYIIFILQALVLTFAMEVYTKRVSAWHEIILLKSLKWLKINALRNCKYNIFLISNYT